MNWLEAIILIGLFALRIAIPLIVTLGIGELISRRYSARQRAAEAVQEEVVCEGYELGPRCWEIKNCDPTTRETCPAYLRPQIPCWLALQVAGRGLPEECFACEAFNHTQPVTVGSKTAMVQGG
jgi:hypothetical protein